MCAKGACRRATSVDAATVARARRSARAGTIARRTHPGLFKFKDKDKVRRAIWLRSVWSNLPTLLPPGWDPCGLFRPGRPTRRSP